MYCDANCRSNPNGDYELVDGRPVLRDGRAARFDISLMRDSAPRAVGVLTLDEQNFKDSAEGQHIVAYAKSNYSLRTRHPSFTGAQWSDQMADAVIREHLARAQAVDEAVLIDGRARAQSALDAIDLNAWRKA